MKLHLRLLLLLPCLTTQAGSAPSWWPVEVTNPSQTRVVYDAPAFIAALLDQSVATIHVDKDLLLLADAWPPELVQVHRNVTIRSLDTHQVRLLNFSDVVGKILLQPGVHMSMRHIAATGSANAYWSLIGSSPHAFFWVRDTTFMPMSCVHKSMAVPAMLTHPRPPEYPGRNRMYARSLPFCFRRRCFVQTFAVGEVFVDRPPYVAGLMVPDYTTFVADSFYACHTFYGDECTTLKGYAACRAEMVQRHMAGLSYSYPQWLLEAAVTFAVIFCCLLVGGGWWLFWCLNARGDRRGRNIFRALSRPARLAVQLAGCKNDHKDCVELQLYIASGSFGHVYQGTWQGLTVAVKVVQHSAKTTPKISREVTICMGLAPHPNIVRTLHHFIMAAADFEGQQPGSTGLSKGSLHTSRLTSSAESLASQSDNLLKTCIVMELCDRGTLSSYLQKTRLANDLVLTNEDLLLDCALGVAQGMAHLHAHHICHGDLKASNVLMMSDASAPSHCVVKVADFGLSRLLDPDSSHVKTQTVGTITHMAPELLMDNRLTCESDVYSFGILLWEMTTGESPYPTLLAGQVLHKIMEGSRPTFHMHVPSDVVALACDCWANEAATRPTFDELVARLQSMIGGRGKRAHWTSEPGSKRLPLKLD